MKRTFRLITGLLFLILAAKSFGQIPNNGFETWTNFGTYEDPTFWGSTNYSSSGTFYAITKSNDHFPVNVGSYSVRIENNTSINPNYSARGYLATGTPPPGPDFLITGHPSSLTGYYKFNPQNGDTMLIQIQLFNNGSSVAYGEFSTKVAALNWTPFNIPISAYTNADNGSIFIAAYYANSYNAIPSGNSVLYVDNLNFDNLISSIPENISENASFSIYPNPANDILNLNIDKMKNADLTLSIYNVIGNLVKSEILKQNNQQINIEDLSNGIYMVEIKSKESSERQKLIIQK
jgi:hypothetical protein